jgi:hypothetical protein
MLYERQIEDDTAIVKILRRNFTPKTREAEKLQLSCKLNEANLVRLMGQPPLAAIP